MKRSIFVCVILCAVSIAMGQTFPDALNNCEPPAGTGKKALAPFGSVDRTAGVMDPILYRLIKSANSFEKCGGNALKARSALRDLCGVEVVRGVDMVSLFIRTADADAVRRIVEGEGGKVFTRAGDILIARTPLSVIRRIAEHPAVGGIESARFMTPALNASRAEIRADMVHAGSNLPRAYTGKDVVVGVVDSGIDWKHPDFQWPTTPATSRVQYLWDMSDSTSGNSTPPSEYGYGREYTKSQIETGLCLERDLEDGGGHGTHVAGTAAGGGRWNTDYRGIAPESDIVFVKGFRSGPGFKDTDVINGCDYIFKRAARLGKPAVINLSLGGQSGAHDGTSLYEQALDALTGPGRIIVAAGGNEGDSRIHLHYKTGGDERKPRVTFFRAAQESPVVVLDIWYSGGPVNIGLAWYSPAPSLIGYFDAVPAGGSLDLEPVMFGSTILALAGIENIGADPSNGHGHAAVVLMGVSEDMPLSDIIFGLYTYGTGTLDGWAMRGEFAPNANEENFIMPGDYNSTVGTPGTAKRLITVGSYVTKNAWVDLNGVTRQQDGNPVIGELSSFSSLGPTRDGRMKPDISAPGEVIVSTLSEDCGAADEKILFGNGYQKMQGTSMASPHVTGTVALMLERNAVLDVPEVLSALTQSARKDQFTGQGNGNRFGHGKLDAYAAVQRVTPRKRNGEVPSSYSVSAYPNPTAGSAVIVYTLPQAGRVTLRVFDALGREVGAPADGWSEAGEYRAVFDASKLPDGVYFYSLQSGAGRIGGRLTHVRR